MSAGIQSIMRGKRTTDDRITRLQSRIRRRFIDKSERKRVGASDPLVRLLVLTYRNYYRNVLLNPSNAKRFERELFQDLQAICSDFQLSPRKMNFETVELELKEELCKRGFFSLFGIVTPFRSLLVWRTQSRRKFRVKLVGGTQSVAVVFLKDFVELGWMHFATFGRHCVGGWAKKDALYCVARRYDLSSDKFRASYLCHEAQHFSDFKKFPKLKQVDLEYRAKLAELVASKRPVQLIRKFQQEAKDDKTLPHSYASFCVVKGLSISPSDRRRRAIAFVASKRLIEHSSQLRARGASVVRGVL